MAKNLYSGLAIWYVELLQLYVCYYSFQGNNTQQDNYAPVLSNFPARSAHNLPSFCNYCKQTGHTLLRLKDPIIFLIQ